MALYVVCALVLRTEFFLSIPGTQNIVCSDESRRFEDRLEEADRHDVLRLLGSSSDHRQHSPRYLHRVSNSN